MYGRISAYMAIALAIVDVGGVTLAVVFGPGHAIPWGGIVTVIALAGAGIVALVKRPNWVVLAAAWGWILGTTIPVFLNEYFGPPMQFPSPVAGGENMVVAYPTMGFVIRLFSIVVALAGLVLCREAQRDEMIPVQGRG
jgi:hypothetical protein